MPEQAASTTLLGLSYGRASEYNRMIFSTLSFWAKYSGDREKINTVILTDNPDYFKPYFTGIDVHYVLVTPEILIEMLRGDTLIHTRKIAAIEQALNLYPENNLLYIDSDTFFTADPAPLIKQITERVSVMHTEEFNLSEMDFNLSNNVDHSGDIERSKFYDTISQDKIAITREPKQLNLITKLWNAGVLGLHKSVMQDIDNVYRLTKFIFRESSWHTSEQIAFSLVLQERGDIIPCDNYIYHYWPAEKKVFYDKYLHSKIGKMIDSNSYAQTMSNMNQSISILSMRQKSMDFFINKEFKKGYNKFAEYTFKYGLDINFLRDVIYLTRMKYVNRSNH